MTHILLRNNVLQLTNHSNDRSIIYTRRNEIRERKK